MKIFVMFVKSICTPSQIVQWLFALEIFRGYLPLEFAVAICRGILQWEFAAAICRGNLPQLFVVVFCREYLSGYLLWVCFLYVNKRFFCVSGSFFFVNELF